MAVFPPQLLENKETPDFGPFLGAKSGVFVFIQIEMRDHGRTVLRRRILPKAGKEVRRRRKQKKPLPRGENITEVKKEPAQAKGESGKKGTLCTEKTSVYCLWRFRGERRKPMPCSWPKA